MSFVRVNCGVTNKGNLIEKAGVEDFIRKQKDKATKDWYVSPYSYGDDALEYWKSNGNSLKGFSGQAWTDHLYWDLDKKGDMTFEEVQKETIKLVKYLVDQNLEDSIEVFFSGNKGFHIILHTEETFTQQELSLVCSGVIKSAGVNNKCFDTSVYNVTRIFRYPHTRHQESGLYKVPLDWELLTGEAEAIFEFAETSHYRKNKDTLPKSSIAELKTRLTSTEHATVAPEDLTADDVLSSLGSAAYDQTTGKRRCIEALEHGDFGPGDRHAGLIRLAAYHHGRGHSREETEEVLVKALEFRAERFPDASLPKHEDTLVILDSVYSPSWKGGTFTCKTDSFLQSKCEHNGRHCWEERQKTEALGKSVIKVGGLIRTYVQYGDDAHEEYAKFGIGKLDTMVRIRPKNFSMIAGASGTGKTSIILQTMDSLNKQKIPHLFMSLDMSDTSLLEKLAARYTPYTVKEIEKAFSKHTRDERIIREVATKLNEELPYSYFDFTSSITMEGIKQKILKLNKDLKDNPVKVVFIDYAGRIQGGGDSAYANATANALMANDVAKDTETHLMFIAQVSRESGDHTTPLRSSRVAKESGSWEENATFVLTCWRPFGDGINGIDNAFAIYVGKNRSGGLGEMHFHWDGKTGSIRDMTTEEYNTYQNNCKAFGKDPPPKGDHPEGIDYAPAPNQATSSKAQSRMGTLRKHLDDNTRVKQEAENNAYDSSPFNTDVDDSEEGLPSMPDGKRRSSFSRNAPKDR